MKDVLKEIRPCDTGKPYIFISYSAKDAARVWEDVRRFQEMGYNIWLDEKNLDKTKASWRSDALTAIQDIDCALLVFYVSRNSLVSEACYSELSCTVEEYTCAVHFGPVKFIAVDVEPIDDIVQFSRVVYDEIRGEDIPKEIKTAQVVTLHDFLKNFFNSNNEKVRVRYRNLQGRKMDYYEEITASFPDSTRVLRPVPPKAAPKKEPPKRVTPQEPPSAKPEPTVEKKAPQPQRVVHRETPPASSETARQKIIRAVNAANAAWGGGFRFEFQEKLTAKQLKNALGAYAQGVSREEVVAFMDTTIMSSGKNGFIVTEKALYSYIPMFKTPVIEFDKLAGADFIQDNKNHLQITYRDGSSFVVYFSIYDKAICPLLETICRK